MIKDEMEGMQIEYKGQQQTLENTIAKKRSQIADFDTQLAAAKKAAAAYTQTIAKKNEEIRKADAEERQRALAEAEARQRAQAEAERKAIAEQEAAKAAALAAQEAASKDGDKEYGDRCQSGFSQHNEKSERCADAGSRNNCGG